MPEHHDDAASEFGAEQLLTLDEAACLVGLATDELLARIERGPVRGRRVRAGGELVAAITRAELAQHFPDRYPAPGSVVPRPAPAPDREALDRLQAQNEELRGELGAATKVERWLQAYADKLETRMEHGRRESLTLARALGQSEARIAALTQRLERLPAPRRSWWRR